MSHRFGPRARSSSSAVMQWGPSLVVSVQRGTVTIATSQTAGTATITTVVMTNSRLRYLGATCITGNATADIANARLTFTNETTITATRNTSDVTATVTVSFEVIEYLPGTIKRVQRGTVATGSSSAITEVNPAKAELDWLGFTSTDTTSNSNQTALMPRVALASGTSVSSVDGGGTITQLSGWQVVEWN